MHTVLLQLASLKLTLVIFVLFCASVVLAYFTQWSPAWILALPFILFALNLAAAILSSPVFWRQPGLLVFHLALLSLIILLAISRLTYLKGHLEVSVDEVFNGELTESESGPFHPWHLQDARFQQKNFTIGYSPGMNRDRTRSQVIWQDENGLRQATTIGDHYPLILAGYRFYTSHNKGFAPNFVWYPADGGKPQQGSIHLPSYPAYEYQQALSWTIPGTPHEIWTLLELDEVVLDENRKSEFKAPEKHRLVIRYNGKRQELRPGASILFADGRLKYESLRVWMGYAVFYDWTIPWLLSACVMTVLGMGWHFWRKFAARPWQAED
ncbi:hypothetical protein MNBD_GAMMA25-811 [hydrothermal vent metagenome]|uniref:ResB-like domain-containing protein n=1 Tax=hydrothermal vent metagenome TaxID=652676 RepID=A0A3B1AXL9_9ZZZZ